ncbi:MAG: zinc-ribbon domain-containing protein [Alphaproteobacteria bacterium]|nr:zinc-ribbon domain-containing protein [Alphaproteobacteria bacterium]MBU1561324.1 zinc-ribbon domain-containing protein [Alphaproteobacteria bacterium]MBU2303868.1 zinc-ribbon domain-containing protein [Alphaproteobacteria bacterium]MBU2366531.1 zinc-ribbon domain-containing protein [Alphaproteobacteria bacterium]
MIITCPHCETKYQVTYEAIGSAGRKVQCAHCQQAWQQRPLDPEPEPPTSEQKEAFEAIAEDGLDEAMADEERKVAAEIAKRLAQEQAADGVQRKAADAGKTEAAMLRKRQKDFTRRQSAMVADLPLARLRRSMRIASVLLVGGLAATGYFARVQVVERYPQMAGVYEAIGLGVNVVGLDFSDVTTLRTLRDGKEVLVVSAQIVGIKREPVVVPSVVVTLLNAEGEGIYEWSVTPSVRDLMAGERSTFDTQLTMPPGEATRVRLSFAGGQDVRKAADGTAGTTAETTPEHN